jgi:von Willebrand factor type A domain/Aerotolerance regulator N-terminal
MSFLGPAFLFMGLLAAPIILIWFLRQRREPRKVPTIFLWQRAMEEERVAPILRRLTRSILLLLQLLALTLLVLAAAGAVLNLALDGESRRVIILLDRSASMSTVEESGETRLAQARAKAGELLATLRGSDRAMLIAFDQTARILTGFTDDTDRVAALLSGVRTVDLGTDPAEALAVAAAAAATEPGEAIELFLFSDGALSPVAELPPTLADASFHFVGTGKETENLAIVSVELDLGLDAPRRLYTQVANPGTRAQTRTLTLEKDGTVLESRDAVLQAGESAGTAFDLATYGSGLFTLRLTPSDAYVADDQALVLAADLPVHRVLVVTRGNKVLERLADFHPTVEVYAVSPDDVGPETGADVGGFSLTIFDGETPESIAPGKGHLAPPAVWLGCTPPGTEVTLGDFIEAPTLVDWDGAHPLNRSVDWSEVLVANAAPVLTGREGTALLEATEGPLIVALPGPGPRVVTGFRLEDSNLPLRLAFPIFFANVMQRAFRGGATETGYLPTGALLTRTPPPGATSAVITNPAGESRELPIKPGAPVSFSATERAGLYRIEFQGAGPVTEMQAVTFLSRAESLIAPRAAIEISGTERASDPEAVEANYPLRQPLLLLALLVLVLEWLLWVLRGRARRQVAPAA